MKDASAKRRSLGKLGIIAAGAIILPLTATIVPAVVAQDETAVPAPPAPPAAPKVVRKVKVIKIGEDGKTVNIIDHGHDGKMVKKIERDGKTFIFHGGKELTDAELDKIADEAEKAGEEAEKAWGNAEVAHGHADEARHAADVARGMAEVHRVRAMHMASAYIPEIDIKEITKNCKEGQPVTTNVEGFDGQSQARVKIVMCGKGYAKVARLEALKGLQEARGDISADSEIPDNVRKDVIEKLEKQIRKLKAETDKAD